jgi:hypothetical protein
MVCGLSVHDFFTQTHVNYASTSFCTILPSSVGVGVVVVVVVVVILGEWQ